MSNCYNCCVKNRLKQISQTEFPGYCSKISNSIKKQCEASKLCVSEGVITILMKPVRKQYEFVVGIGVHIVIV